VAADARLLIRDGKGLASRAHNQNGGQSE